MANAGKKKSVFIISDRGLIMPPHLSFSTSLVYPEIRFGRRLFYGQDALRGI